MLQFQNKVALITGSGTGIGMTVAKKFVENGASVIILGRRKEPLESTSKMLEEIIHEKQTDGFVKIFSGVDVSDTDSVTEMFDSLVDEDIKLDIVVNNAGVSGPVTCFSHAPFEDFESAVHIHLTGTYWTSNQALRVMKEGSKIITISTFFTEEKPYEQRPYRFRSPYTAAQGAKNRLVEAMSWELADKGIISIGTNPGPVHSDRIYKTVYPKAAAEFLRVSGFEELNPSQVETATKEILGVLGEDEETVKSGINAAAEKLGMQETTLTNLLNKIQSIAEKIQKNTSTMIADNQFLSQDQVATTILTLAGDEQAKILNGKVIPGDRVFYHVKPHVTSSIPKIEKNNLDGKKIVSVDCDERNPERGKIRNLLEKQGAKISEWGEFNDAIQIIETGNMDPNSNLIDGVTPSDSFRVTGMALNTDTLWYGLVNQFLLDPAERVQGYLNEVLVPGGSEDPRKYKDTKGRIIIIGPRLPRAKTKEGEKMMASKLSKARAKAEVFRGALRPFVTTVNQELSDVLKSNIRVFLILPGSVDGKEPSDENLIKTINYLISDEAGSNPEVIFCPDESR